MCLEIKLTKITKKPLKVYKALLYNNKTLLSPYQKKKYLLNHEFKIENFDIYNNANLRIFSDLYVTITYGIHSWTSLNAAFNKSPVECFIFEAEIPAGSKIIYGDNNDVVSSRLIIKPYFYKPIKFLDYIFYRKIEYCNKTI